jgi:hypothetical protein
MKRAAAEFDALTSSLVPVSTPVGDGWVLARDEGAFRAAPRVTEGARLLPSGDTFYLLQGEDRALLVPDARLRDTLWTSRVWPGALMLDGDIVGIWRRSQHRVKIEPWRRLSADERRSAEDEAATLPLPDMDRDVVVTWED